VVQFKEYIQSGGRSRKEKKAVQVESAGTGGGSWHRWKTQCKWRELAKVAEGIASGGKSGGRRHCKMEDMAQVAEGITSEGR
jgi:hypothetical protein